MDQTLQHGHLDPDQLNAFAEGVLPEHERLLVMAHLADCPSCREVAFLAQEALAGESPAPATAHEPVRAPFWKRWFGPLPLAGAAALACAAVAFVMWHTPPTVQAPHNQVAEVKQEQPPVVAAQSTAKSEVGATPEYAAKKQAKSLPPPKPVASPAARGDLPSARIASDSAISMPAPQPMASGGPVLRSLPPSQAAQKSAAIPSRTAGPDVSSATREVAAAPPLADQAPKRVIDAQSIANIPASGRDTVAAPSMSAGAAAGSSNRAALYAAARADGNSGIRGTVTDPAGAAISGVNITLHIKGKGTEEKSAAKSATTDALGKFSLTGLLPGTYEVEFTTPGFQLQTQTVDLQPRQLAQLDSKLSIGVASQTVTVDAAEMAAETSSAAKRRSSPCDDPLPSGKPRTACQLSGEKTMVVDQGGSVFLRNGNGRWKAVKAPWSSSIRSLGLSGTQFEIVTVDGATWLSSDGRHWALQPSR